MHGLIACLLYVQVKTSLGESALSPQVVVSTNYSVTDLDKLEEELQKSIEVVSKFIPFSRLHYIDERNYVTRKKNLLNLLKLLGVSGRTQTFSHDVLNTNCILIIKCSAVILYYVLTTRLLNIIPHRLISFLTV